MGLEAGETVGERYRIIAPLGEGGMGAVYQAEHIYMRKQVALKVLHASFAAQPEIVARFEREAVAAGNIQHPNVATATDFGRLPDGSFFLILELVAGRSLREELRRGPISCERALRILRQVVQGVGAAHEKGIIHRDLKPENIMLLDGTDDSVKVLDFGVAKLASGDSNHAAEEGKLLTQLGQIFGTPDYMAPEQAIGEAIDHRADFYAVGVILYELLAGKLPFEGGTMTLLRDRVFKDTPPPLPADLPITPEVRALVEKLMARLPNDRPSTAEQIVAAIDHASFARSPTIPAVAQITEPVASAPALGSAKTLVASSVLGWQARVLNVPVRYRIAAAVLAAVVFLAITIGAFSHSPESTTAAPSSSTSVRPAASSPKPPATQEDLKPLGEESKRADVAVPSDSAKPKSKGKRSGPGGIYIPPPSQWFR